MNYLEELQVIQEDEVKYHCLFIKLASLLVRAGGSDEAGLRPFSISADASDQPIDVGRKFQ